MHSSHLLSLPRQDLATGILFCQASYTSKMSRPVPTFVPSRPRANAPRRRPTTPAPGMLEMLRRPVGGEDSGKQARGRAKSRGREEGGRERGQEAEALRERMSLAGRMSADAGEDERPGPLLGNTCCSSSASLMHSSSSNASVLPLKSFYFSSPSIRNRTHPRIKHRIE